MAADASLVERELDKFRSYTARLKKSTFQDNEEHRKAINLLLDDFNGIEYSLRILSQEFAGDVLKQFCFLVPLTQEMLVTKVCQLIVNLVSRQKLVLDHNVEIVTEYIVKGLQQCQAWTFNDLLQALSALVYENSGKISQFHTVLVGKKGLLLQMVDSVDEDMQRSALHCIENLCARTTQGEYLTEEQQATCWNIFMRLLHAPKPMRMDDVNHCRIVISCLRGLQNLLTGSKSVPSEQLGPLLAAVKVYMLHGMPNHRSIVPPTLYPTPAIHYDPQPAAAPSQSSSAEKKEEKSPNLRPGAGKTAAKPAKKSKKRRSKASTRERHDDEEQDLVSQMESFNTSDVSEGQADIPNRLVPSLLPTWANISGSESDFSDTEGGQTSKLRAYCSKITEKRVMFGYWTSFLPDTPSIGGPSNTASLFTVITRDPSPRVRASALAVLTALLEGTRSYVAAVEDVDPSRQAFTPFSVTLGAMVKEMHRCLMLALVAENSPLAITQIIKCLATLIPNVPYQRLKPGLLSKVVKQIKPFLAHRDPNIRVACLTCLGSIVSVQTPLVEVWQVLQTNRAPVPQRFSSSSIDPSVEESGRLTPANASGGASGESSGITTPVLSSGAMTPTLSEQIFTLSSNVSWVVRLAVKNISPHLIDCPVAEGTPSKRSATGTSSTQPLPVRLESLQLLAKLAKGYFATVRDSLPLMCDVIQNCLEDRDPSVQLHGAKLLEEIGSMLLQNAKIQPEMPGPDTVEISKAVEFWMNLLNGQLPKVLQGQENNAARSTACNCLSNIGPLVFEKLPMPKRIMCITILLGLTSDDDHHVRAAAVRAIGVYVLYPCLREDVSFVSDAASSIIASLDENNIVVKIKAAWSLGNISDALVLNKSNNDDAFLEDFSDEMLLKLFKTTIAASDDSDKVRSNAVRALGNLLRYFPQRCLANPQFDDVLKQGVQKLVKNVGTGTMKVRWNACYAMSNVFKNSSLPLGTAEWTDDVHNALATVVRNCKNFKVRINAAMAFSVPVKRENFGSTQTFIAVWDSLVGGLQGSETVNDFMEYKYRDSLLEQVCSTLLHLALVISVTDLRALNKILSPRRSIIYEYLGKFKTLKRSVPDSGPVTPVRSASSKAKEVDAYLKTLANHDLKEEQTLVVDMLKEILVEPIIGEVDSRPASPKPSFSQTYD